MKKFIGVVLVLAIVFTMVGCSDTIGNEGLIVKARKEIGVSDDASVQVFIAGKSTINYTDHLFWFVEVNENQEYRYIPIEFIELENEQYEFVKKYSALERGQDVYVVTDWHEGYSFFVNNAECKSIKITDSNGVNEVKVTEYPFIYYNSSVPTEYSFLDENGVEVQ